MGKVRDLEIRYDRPSVFAGGLLSGNLCFSLKESLKLRELSLWVEGQTKVTLPGDSSNERWLLRTELNLTPYLVQYDFRIPRGFHQVPFAFPLPPMLPSSFGDKYGYIYYCCRAVLGHDIGKIRKPFTLIGIEDLNWHPQAAMPMTLREYGCKSFWAFGRQSGAVQVLLTLDRTGYVPGECIEVTAEIVNKSKKKLRCSLVQLRQGVLYKGSGGRTTKETFQIIADAQHGPVQPGGIDQWEKEQILIPPAPPSFLRGSEHISSKYELVFSIPDASVTLVMPIIIGTVPFHPSTARRIVKALPWHEEPIYGTRPVVKSEMHQQPAPVYRQPYYSQCNGMVVDENGPPVEIDDGDDEPDDHNNNYRNGFKQSRNEKMMSSGHEKQKTPCKPQNRQEGIYNNGCYYYNEQPRFLRIEEID